VLDGGALEHVARRRRAEGDAVAAVLLDRPAADVAAAALHADAGAVAAHRVEAHAVTGPQDLDAEEAGPRRPHPAQLVPAAVALPAVSDRRVAPFVSRPITTTGSKPEMAPTALPASAAVILPSVHWVIVSSLLATTTFSVVLANTPMTLPLLALVTASCSVTLFGSPPWAPAGSTVHVMTRLGSSGHPWPGGRGTSPRMQWGRST